MNELGRALLALGIVLALAGLVLIFADRLPLRELSARLPLGRLPGDIHVERGNFFFSFPLVTCLVVSIVLSLIFWLLRR